jgi:hypothetical protein
MHRLGRCLVRTTQAHQGHLPHMDSTHIQLHVPYSAITCCSRWRLAFKPQRPRKPVKSPSQG